ncbi:MAG: VOC family protein [Polyangiaceae bacterium]|nr:VOC family protein [Polyangiaceae bacterium]NUQ76670.1 VOC family protein [Polyangiaceae bacterium]
MPSFSHIALNVTDLQRSVQFYTSVLRPLSFHLADSLDGHFARITNGKDAVIVLAPVGDKYRDRIYHRRAVGLAHFALAVETRAQLDEMAKHLASLGVALLGQGRVESEYRRGYSTFSFEDPDRIMIEIVHHDAYYFSTSPP